MNFQNQKEFSVGTKVQVNSTTFLRGAPVTLPTPVREYQFGDVHFFVYKVKDKKERIFPNEALYSLLQEARRSYLRYGQVPLTDSYDEKSSIYLTRVVYPHTVDNVAFPIEEWVSVRFVPASGNPLLSEDLDVCVYQNQPLTLSLRKTLFPNRIDPLKHLVTISRICRIAPRVPTENVFFTGTFIPQKNTYTALAFTAMNKVFLEESEKNGDEIDFFTALAREELFEKVLHFERGEKKAIFPFAAAENILNPDKKHRLRINRNILSYRHPGYFLNLEELIQLFGKLIDFGRLTEKSWQQHIKTQISFAECQEHSKTLPYHEILETLDGLSEMLLAPSWIENSRMHGTELRSLVDICVSDAVKLYMSPIDSWKKEIENITEDFFTNTVYEPETTMF